MERMTRDAASRRVITTPVSMPASSRRRSESRFSSSSGIAIRGSGGPEMRPAPASFPSRNVRMRHRSRARFLVPLFLLGALVPPGAWAATGWIPPRTVTVLLPGATVAPGSVHTLELTFQVHGMAAVAETLDVTADRSNPDPNNAGALFPGSPPPATPFLPAHATIAITVPTTIAGSAYAGSANTVSCTVSSLFGNSTASAHALASAALPESLPTALVPVGLVPMAEPAAGRDGPVELPWRGLWLLPAGLEGVRVI